MTQKAAVVLAAMTVGGALNVLAGPPFLTDDPEPVDYQNWEFYVASMHVPNRRRLVGDGAAL